MICFVLAAPFYSYRPAIFFPFFVFVLVWSGTPIMGVAATTPNRDRNEFDAITLFQFVSNHEVCRVIV